MSDKWIRASEIGEYMYCRRAWWLRRVAGIRPTDPVHAARQAAGSAYHRAHAAELRSSTRWATLLNVVLLSLGFVSVLVIAWWFLAVAP